jgi:hypothetical protein
LTEELLKSDEHTNVTFRDVADSSEHRKFKETSSAIPRICNSVAFINMFNSESETITGPGEKELPEVGRRSRDIKIDDDSTKLLSEQAAVAAM